MIITELDLEENKKIETSEVSNYEYHASCGLSSSNIKDICSDVDGYLFKKGNDTVKSKALKTGTWIDDYIFENESFDKKYLVSDSTDRKKAQFKKDVENNPDLEVLSLTEFELISSMSTALKTHAVASNILNESETQLSFFVKDSFDGIISKARPDIIKNSVIWDLKSCADITDHGLRRSINSFKYDISLGHYANVISRFREVHGAGWIFVSKSKPIQIRVISMPESHFNESKDKALDYLLMADKILKNEKTTYSEEIQEFNYYFNRTPYVD